MAEPDGPFVVDFSASGNSAQYRGIGWSHQEPAYVWGLGPAAELVLPGRAAPLDMRLVLDAVPLVRPPVVPTQRLILHVNGRRAAEAVLTKSGLVEMAVPAEFLPADGPVRLRFELPDAASPRDLGESDDRRKLAVACRRLEWGEDRPAAAAIDAVLIQGNHQAHALARILSRLEPLNVRFEFRHLPDDAPAADLAAALRPADTSPPAAFWQQMPESGALPAADLPSGVRRTVFPALSARLLWPFIGPDPRCVPEPPAYPGGRYPVGDAVAARLAAEAGADDDALMDRYIRESAEAFPDPDKAYDDFAAACRALDRADVQLGAFVLGAFPAIKLFHGPADPSGPMMIALAERLILESGIAEEQGNGAVLRELRRMARGYQGLFQVQLPIHPLVAERYGLAWYDPDALYRFHYNKWSFRKYTLNYIRWRPWAP